MQAMKELVSFNQVVSYSQLTSQFGYSQQPASQQ